MLPVSSRRGTGCPFLLAALRVEPRSIQMEQGWRRALSDSVKVERSRSQRQVMSKYWESWKGVTQVSGPPVRTWSEAPGLLLWGARLWGTMSSCYEHLLCASVILGSQKSLQTAAGRLRFRWPDQELPGAPWEVSQVVLVGVEEQDS